MHLVDAATGTGCLAASAYGTALIIMAVHEFAADQIHATLEGAGIVALCITGITVELGPFGPGTK